MPKIFFSSFLLLFTFNIFSQASSPVFHNKKKDLKEFVKKYLVYSKKNYTVGVLKLSYEKNLSTADISLTSTIANTWYNMASTIKKHYYKKNEINKLKNFIFEKAIFKKEKDLLKLQKKRDEIIFSFSNKLKKKKEIKEKDKEIKNFKKLIKFYKENINAKEIEIPEFQSIKLKKLNEYSPLLESEYNTYEDKEFYKKSLRELAKIYGLDLLLFGRIELLYNDYLHIETASYNYITDEIENDLNFSVQKKDLLKSIVSDSKDVMATVVGTQYLDFTLKTIPETAKIYLDGEFVGSGFYHNSYQVNGIYSVEIKEDGYSKVEQALVLGRGIKSKELLVKLRKSKNKKIFIDSVPSDYKVYKEGIFIGETPLFVDTSEDTKLLLFKKEGFLNRGLEIDSKTKDLTINSNIDFFDSQEEFVKRKREFYMSLGFFTGSLLIPAIFEGLYISTGDSMKRLDRSSKVFNNLYLKYNSYFWVRNFGIALSSALLIDLVVKTVRYVKSSKNFFDY